LTWFYHIICYYFFFPSITCKVLRYYFKTCFKMMISFYFLQGIKIEILPTFVLLIFLYAFIIQHWFFLWFLRKIGFVIFFVFFSIKLSWSHDLNRGFNEITWIGSTLIIGVFHAIMGWLRLISLGFFLPNFVLSSLMDKGLSSIFCLFWKTIQGYWDLFFNLIHLLLLSIFLSSN
jgi:hypothetical protein